jgi:hypothetical protein
VALEGTLRDFSLADIFQLIGLQRKTGVLTLRAPEDVVTVSFLDGKVVGADSLNKRLEDRLGQVLLKTGAVTQEELDAALRLQMETLERLGHILLRSAIISREELRRALEQQVLQIIFRVFRWNDGDYHFSQETSLDYDVELITPMGAESILMEGARMLDEWPIIEKRIPTRTIVFIPDVPISQLQVVGDTDADDLHALDLDDEPEARPQPLGRKSVTQVESDVLRLVDGMSTVDDIVRNSAHGEFETCKALYTMLTRTIIREARPEEQAVAQARAAALTEGMGGMRPSGGARLPWLALPLVPVLVLSQALAARNPANPVAGDGPKVLPRVEATLSAARMWGIWQALNARSALVGSYPEALAELAGERILPDSSLRDLWGRAYRYTLREDSLTLAGSTRLGAPDPNLMFSKHLLSSTEQQGNGPGATLVEP